MVQPLAWLASHFRTYYKNTVEVLLRVIETHRETERERARGRERQRGGEREISQIELKKSLHDKVCA